MVRPRVPEGQRRQDMDPAERGFPQLGRVSESVRDRMDKYRGYDRETRRGDLSLTQALSALLDLAEAPPAAPVEVPAPVDLTPISDALHEVERKVSEDRFSAKEGLLRALRDIRRQVEELKEV